MAVALGMTPDDEREFKALAKQVMDAESPPTFAHVRLKDIRVDSYQRDLNAQRVEKMVREYDVHRFQPVELSLRADKTYWCIEGQHRLATARRLGMQVVPAMVHVGLTQTDEALLFWLFQRDRRALTVWDNFNARLIGHEAVAVSIDKTVRDLGLTYGRGMNYDIQALVCLERLHDAGGAALLSRTLSTIQRVWPISARRFDGTVIGGLGLILHRFGSQIDEERLETILTGITPSYIVAEVRSLAGQKTADRFDYASANIIRTRYNQRLGQKKQLPPLMTAYGRALPGNGKR